MAVDTVGKMVRVTAAFMYSDTQLEVNNLTYVCTAAGSTDSRGGLGSTVLGAYNTNYSTMMSANSLAYGYRVATLMPRPADASIEFVGGFPGGDAGNYLGTQCRPVLAWKTALAGPSHRGRVYLPTPAVTQITAGGFPSGALAGAAGALALALMGPIVTGGSTWKLHIAHKLTSHPPTYSSELVTAPNWPGVFGTMRKSGNTGEVNATPW